MMKKWRFFLGGIVFIVLILTVVITHWLFADLPSIDQLNEIQNFPSLRIVDRSGRLLYEDLGENSIRYHPLRFQEIPDCIKQATIATEDASFFSNPGFDVKGMLRALWINLRGGDTIAGGSTITQQLVRNLLLEKGESEQRTVKRKLREIYLAWQITHHYTKEQILSLYLNHTYYGSFAYGIEAASLTYFGIPAKQLDLAQCAVITGLPQAPSIYNPFIHPDAAKKRQKVVLERMAKLKFITDQQFTNAIHEELNFSEAPYPMEAPHFVMYVRNQVDQLISSGQLSPNARLNDLTIYTSLDLNLEKTAEKAIQSHLTKLALDRGGLGHNVHDAALVAINPKSGEILAMVGSANYQNEAIYGAINMAITPRQPGSALKPFVYALAMDPNQLNPLMPGSLIWDKQTNFQTRDGKTYTPVNYDGKEHGLVTVREALGSSLNIPAVMVLNQIGLQRFSAFAQTIGLTSLRNPETYDLTIALGGGGVSLLELTSAYSIFAAQGIKNQPYAILSIQDKFGNVLYQYQRKTIQVVDPQVAWLISDILHDDNARTIGFGRNSILNIDRPAAVKTGTTTNFHDNWTIGYTPQIVVGVWVGNADYQPMMEVTGLSGAAPIWHEFIRQALLNQVEEWYPRPPTIISTALCKPISPFTEQCGSQYQDWMIVGTHPLKSLNFNAVPSEPNQSQAFEIISPHPNAVYIKGQNQPVTIPLTIRNNNGLDTFKVFLNQKQIATLDRDPKTIWLDLQPGVAVITIEGWQNNQLMETQTISITVNPPLR